MRKAAISPYLLFRRQYWLLILFPLVIFHSSAQCAESAETEILVIGHKNQGAVREIPLAISVFEAEYLDRSSIDNLNDLQRYAPSLSLQQNRSPFDSALRIRGIGNEGNIPNFEPDVALYIDGALRVRTGLGLGDLLEVERIEVLKGPQSSLYGKNATAGVVHIITPKPLLDGFSTSAEMSLGSDDQVRFRGHITGPLSSSSAYRVSLLSDQRDGWMQDLNGQDNPNEVDHQAMRAQYLFEPSDQLSLRLIGSYSEKQMTCCTPDISWSGDGINAFLAATGETPADTKGLNRVVSINQPHRFNGDSQDFSAIFEYESEAIKLTAISSYDEYNYTISAESSYSELDLFRQLDQQYGDTFSQEIRFHSVSDGKLSWLAGLYWFDSTIKRDARDQPIFTAGNDWPAAAPGLAAISSTPLTALSMLNTVPGDQVFLFSGTDTQSKSVFGQMSGRLGSAVVLTAGARYLEEEKQFSLMQRSLDVNGVPIIAVLSDADPANDTRMASLFNFVAGAPGDFGDVDSMYKTDAWTWDLSAMWTINSQINAYATVSRGFKSGGFNGDWGKQTLGDPALGLAALLVPENADDRRFDDETVDHIELGFKSILLSGRMILNTAIFRSEYDDLQVAAFTGLNFIVSNANRATTQGVEIDGRFDFDDNWRLNYAVTYLDAQYNDFASGQCGDRALAQSCSGFPMPFTPDLETLFGLQYVQPVVSGEWYTRLDWQWRDEYSASSDFYPDTLQDSYSVFNLNVGWQTDRYTLSLWMNNLTDKTYQVAAGTQPLYNGILRYLNEPRMMGFTFKYQH